MHKGTIPSNDLRPVLHDEFDLRDAALVFRFRRDAERRITGFNLSGFRERWIGFERLTGQKDASRF